MPQSPLVTTGWLAGHLDDPALRIVDIRGHVAPPTDPLPHYFNHHDNYLTSHIPGATFIDWVHEITDPNSPHHAKIAPPERFADSMRKNGIGPSTLVVAYDDAQGMFAARLWWALNYYGHDRVSVLDGGWQKWVAEGRPVTASVPDVAPALFMPRPQLDWIRTEDDVKTLVTGHDATRRADETRQTVLIDVRTSQEYHGQASRANRYGHIPGAINVPRQTLIGPDGALLPPDELRRRFAGLGIKPDTSRVICYCNGGVSASYGVLALRTAGFADSANYDGSWKEWGNDATLPIE